MFTEWSGLNAWFVNKREFKAWIIFLSALEWKSNKPSFCTLEGAQNTVIQIWESECVFTVISSILGTILVDGWWYKPKVSFLISVIWLLSILHPFPQTHTVYALYCKPCCIASRCWLNHNHMLHAQISKWAHTHKHTHTYTLLPSILSQFEHTPSPHKCAHGVSTKREWSCFCSIINSSDRLTFQSRLKEWV